MPQLLIGIDDTDDANGPGTGRRARQLGTHLAGSGLGAPSGVTRHQLLVDDRIPYTSHNSALCLALESAASLSEVAHSCRDFLSRCCAEGSDPGLCVAWAEAVDSSVVEFGYAAKQVVLSKADALGLAAEQKVWLEELGGSGGGVIGALAAVALRRSGEDGRFVELAGIRDLREDILSARDILARTAIGAIVDENGEAVPLDDLVHFGGWLRPSLREGRPVLLVRRRGDSGISSSNGERALQKGWVTIEHKHKSANDSHKARNTISNR
ncbi:MAG: hypothetical protein M1343_05655 [Chloroflexi bacterium]|nr:hypothetical protein [Chloroflexota bacterium]MDA8189799.1 hypothetical protein [Dehalococcoidales bacterium]